MTRTDLMFKLDGREKDFAEVKQALIRKGYVGIDMNGYQIWRKDNFMVELIVSNGKVHTIRVNAEEDRESLECFLDRVNKENCAIR